jgi:ribosome-associated protein
MDILKLREKDEYITLGQLLKAAGCVENGVEAKEEILSGHASVNGEVDTRRGRKLYDGDVVKYRKWEIRVVR